MVPAIYLGISSFISQNLPILFFCLFCIAIPIVFIIKVYQGKINKSGWIWAGIFVSLEIFIITVILFSPTLRYFF